MSDLTHFDQLPLSVATATDGSKNAEVSLAGTSVSTYTPRQLAAELEALNALHRELLTLETPIGVPPPPLPVNPKLSAAVTKMKDSGGIEFRKGNHVDAERQYTLALQMALKRPLWEPSALVREEAALLLSNRAQARMADGRWAEGAVDAEASVEAKRLGNAKAWWRRGKCLAEMGRWEEAKEWVSKGLEVEVSEELVALGKEIEDRMAKRAQA